MGFCKSTNERYGPKPGLPRTDLKFATFPVDGVICRDMLDEQLLHLVFQLPAGTYIAGGAAASAFCNNKDAADIDLFFKGPEVFEEAVEKLLSLGYRPVDVAKEVTEEYRLKFGANLDNIPLLQFRPASPCPGYDRPVQAIKLTWYDSIEACLDCFDFTATQFGIDVAKKLFVLNPLAPLDVAAKSLRVHRLEREPSLLKRVEKYQAKGYQPDEELLKLIQSGTLQDTLKMV